MSKQYSIAVENGITRIVCLQKPTYEDATRMIDDVAENFPYEKRLWDFSKIQFDFSMQELMAISNYGKQKFLKPNRVAIIAPDDLAFGEMRVFQVYREQEEHSVARAFRTEAEALEWLR